MDSTRAAPAPGSADPLGREVESLRREAVELEIDRIRLSVEVDRVEERVYAIKERRWSRMGEAARAARGRRLAAGARLARIALGGRAPRETRALLESASRAFAAGRCEEAVAGCDRALARDPANRRAHDLKRRALVRMGEPTRALEAVRAAREAADSPSLRRAERGLAGRIRELDPAWLPEIPGPPEPLTPVSPWRVLHLLKFSAPYHTNGYTMRSRYALRAQRDAGLDPVAVTSLGFPRTDGVERFAVVEEVDGTAHHRLDAGADFPYREAPLDRALSIGARLASGVVRGVRPALLQARSGFRGYETALVGLALARRFGLPLVYEVSSFLEQTWTADPLRAESAELYRARLEQERRCMREADHVVTIASSMREEIVARGIDPARVTVIPNAVDAAAFPPRDPDPALRRALGLEGRTVLGYVSNLGAREGIDVLVRATALLAGRGLPVACLVVGEGPERPALESLARALGIAGAVRLTGEIPHERVTDYYAQINVFVVPRRDDRAARFVTPLKPFEAMAMGRPLVVSALPALLEIAAPEARGLSFEPESAESLAAVAERLVLDPDLRRRLGEAGRAWVLAERTWEANGRRYRALYEEVLAARAAGRAP